MWCHMKKKYAAKKNEKKHVSGPSRRKYFIACNNFHDASAMPPTFPIPCPDPTLRALRLFPKPWEKLQGYSQDLAERLSPEQLEFIFEYILNGGGKGIECLPLQRWNDYFQIKSMKSALSTTRGIEPWKNFCKDRGVTSTELERREDRRRSVSQQKDQDLLEERKEEVTIPPNSFPCLPC